MSLKVIVAAGGTGGDLFPAVAVIEQLQKLTSAEAIFVGNPKRIEATVVPKLGFDFHALNVTGFKGLRSLSTYTLPFKILQSYRSVRRLIRDFKPDLALCAGTYISYPLALAASHARVPLALIESNAIPGKANRFVADRADLIIAAFDECKNYFSPRARSKVRVLGNPIRQTFGALPSQAEARLHFGLDPQMKTLFVVGGSLGARSLNQAVLHSLNALQSNNIQVLWQTGSNFEIPPDLPFIIHPLAFIDDMASAYASADLVVSRAGGGTVAELGVVGKAAVLVPYPYAANNEQEYNARALEKKGAAIMVRDHELIASFELKMLELMNDPAMLATMSTAMASCGRPRAAEDAARELMKLVST